MPYADGHLDVGVFPEAFEAGVIEVPTRYLVGDVLHVDGTADGREALQRVGR